MIKYDKDVIIIGGGEHCKAVLNALRLCGANVIGYTDPGVTEYQKTLSISRLGDDSILEERYPPDSVLLVNGIGSVRRPHARREAFERLKRLGYTFACVVHPFSAVAADSVMEEGSQAMEATVVQSSVRLGPNVLVNIGSIVGHDCQIDAHVHIATGCKLSGTVNVGYATHLGTGTNVIQGITIGKHVLVGAGATVIRDIPDHAFAVGVPAEVRWIGERPKQKDAT